MAEQFRPRTPHSIMRDLISKVVSRTELNDVTIGSSLYVVMQSIAYEVASMEARMAKLRNSFDLNIAAGADLDTRVAELPPVGISRQRQTVSSGAVLRITRNDGGVGELVIPENSIVARSSDNFQYYIPENVTIPDGETVANNVQIVAVNGGSNGNTTSFTIDTIITMPAGVGKVENVGPITNGYDRESDASLRNRALRYIRSLGRCQVDALTSLALNFIDSNGSTFRFANVFEDPENLGYSELIVDDGSGLRQFVKAGERTSGIVPPGGQDFIYHQFPAVDHITPNSIMIVRGGAAFTPPQEKIVSIPERGIVYFKDNYLQEGDEWSISSYDIYKGPIQELQKEVEGSTGIDGSISTGFRAAGTRVRVKPPVVKDISMTALIDVKPEYDINETKRNVKNVIEAYVANLGIGEPLYIADLVKTVMNQTSLWSIKLYNYNSDVLLENIYPGDQKTVLRTTAANINYK